MDGEEIFLDALLILLMMMMTSMFERKHAFSIESKPRVTLKREDKFRLQLSISLPFYFPKDDYVIGYSTARSLEGKVRGFEERKWRERKKI